jgi:hypothetical protein
MRVFGWQTRVRTERERRWKAQAAPSTDHDSPMKDLSLSISVGTRKMVNYACAGRSQGKPWWRLVAVLTCKLIVRFGYRGERLIEPSSSWFPPKFPYG